MTGGGLTTSARSLFQSEAKTSPFPSPKFKPKTADKFLAPLLIVFAHRAMKEWRALLLVGLSEPHISPFIARLVSFKLIFPDFKSKNRLRRNARNALAFPMSRGGG